MSSALAVNEVDRPPPRRLDSGWSCTALWTLYVLTLRQHQHGKRWMVIGILMLLPPGLALVMRGTAHDVPSIALEFILAFMFIPQALLPLAALIYASGMIQDEQEEQTITYLLVRPIPKWAFYTVKLIATLTVTILLTVVFTVLTYVAIYLGRGGDTWEIVGRCLKASCMHALAVSAYCCLFGLMSLLIKRILVVGILYIGIFEGLFANLAFGIRLLTVIYYARMIAYRTLPFMVPTPLGMENFAADAWQLDIQNDPKLLEHPQIGTCLVVLIVGCVVCAVLAAIICSRREFNVKTPEKG